jgi:hypothetical protein
MELNDEMQAGGADSAMQSDGPTQAKSSSDPAAAADPIAAPPLPINPDDLHDLFAGGPSQQGSDEEDPLAQLRNDPNYSALIRDLEYIAAQARLLFAPAEETPSDDLWNKIESKMSSEPEAE